VLYSLVHGIAKWRGENIFVIILRDGRELEFW
jgi:hypothetical protein